jgi:hypothetical protein
MRFLVGWDDPAQLDLISSFLNLDGTSAVLCHCPDDFCIRAKNERFDMSCLQVDGER